jgi:threonine aldolase
MNFSSDNWAGASDVVAAKLTEIHASYSASYGESALDDRMRALFCEVFEREVSVFTVGTGTAANSLALTACARPGGVIFCHPESHIFNDECGAVEYFSGGARLCTVAGPGGKFSAVDLVAAMDRYPKQFVHAGQPTALSLTQATEVGTAWSLAEIAGMGEMARANDLYFHMDGARFANALVALDATPAEMTWRRGVDILSFGATKNGCWCAEAVVIFNPALAAQFAFLHKRAGQLFSKSTFQAAQFVAYFEAEHWLNLARHTNAMADCLRERIALAGNMRIAWPTQTNEIFVLIDKSAAERSAAAGAVFSDWPEPINPLYSKHDNEYLYRFVTSFRTDKNQIDVLLASFS